MNQEQLRQKVAQHKEQSKTITLDSLRATKSIHSHNPAFKKTDEEKSLLHKFKKEHNKKWFNIFGTKRITAGKVDRYFKGEAY